jgi:hypothetical protein
MPKIHNIGPLFVQVTNFPYNWEGKAIVRGWTQEINDPYRTATPLILRLPKYKALVFGRWTGTKTEEEALSMALKKREVTEDDFTEEAGWTPAPDSDREESLHDLVARFDHVDGNLDVYNWQTYYLLAEEPEPSGS